MENFIYFDSSATTRVLPEVIKRVESAINQYGNPSSLHTLGFEAEKSMRESRARLENLLMGEVTYTASGTEANNIAILSGARKNKRAGNRIITTDSEHPSVLECMKVLEAEGFEVKYLSTKKGEIDFCELDSFLSEKVCLVSVMHTNNETGALYPVAKISSLVKAKYPRALVHSDCVQAFLKSSFTLACLGADIITLSAHKVHAPKGTGALVTKKGLVLPPVIFGGGQEKGVRSGTENTLGIAALDEAVKTILADKDRILRVEEVSERLVTLLSDVEVELNLPENKSPFIINFSVPGIRSETLLHALSQRNVFVSSGSACSSKSHGSYVLRAFGLSEKLIDSAVRVSLSELNTLDEAERFVEILKEEITKLGGRK